MNLVGGINNRQDVYVKISINKSIENIIKKDNVNSIINIDGILLIVIDELNSKEYITMLKEDENKAKHKLKELMKKIKTKEKAVGIILLEKNLKLFKIHPVIWVKEIDTVYYETACGSGSLATAIYLNSITKKNSFEILQPSEFSIRVELKIENNYILNATVSGKVME